MYNGNILLNCTPNELRSTVNKDKLILTINSNITKKEINGQVIKLNNHFPYLNFIQNNNKITVLLKKAYFIIQKIIYFLPSNFIISIYISKPTLNDAYLKITGSCLNKNLKTNNN
jgi:hypothetical protein